MCLYIYVVCIYNVCICAVCLQLLAQPADSQEEITARHHIADQLERRFIPRPLCKSSLFAEFNNELKILKEAVHSGSGARTRSHTHTHTHRHTH